ncbi:adenine nucleotide alpha hydrolase family protein [Aliarcobacter cryaerophilus]|uniref:Flagellin modification protein PseA n=2 Tax=unclassified Arcobacter TaxID=2593671 RepID=A0AA96DH99_9BACT|nr:flagellin modification protein PseA [Arcobacter sp. AZ-2023]WPD09112.1 flagellin modification protein PseA [Arcobacter sp. DSM 115954]WNL13943.1 flagellin modification protein PseA [Arcobacter sp. AZ-2023]WNL20176.1 flagellin modification protein PseA [Arcobacter sp. AZ-2023]WNL22318.1 flagellin modification protein PseA [Arcobacter sp. AZ-2023]
MKNCSHCGFPLGSRPGLKDDGHTCFACLNIPIKNNINFKERQEWLTEYISKNKKIDSKYDCIVAVSGGKDSHMIVKRLIENHGIVNPLLVTLLDEFTQTQAGISNIKNISEYFDLDHILFRYKPKTAKREMYEGFVNELNPLKTHDDRMVGFNGIATNFAKLYNINLVFYGENAEFEYGNSDELKIFHPMSNDDIKYIYLGAIYPYSIKDSLNEAKLVGFKDLDDFEEWDRQGTIENYTQLDSVGYIAHQWCKFVKFGAQRCADIASRLVREGAISKEQAILSINEKDYILDPKAKRDLCKTIGIDEKYFDEIVDKHANLNIVEKDINGIYKRKK